MLDAGKSVPKHLQPKWLWVIICKSNIERMYWDGKAWSHQSAKGVRYSSEQAALKVCHNLPKVLKQGPLGINGPKVIKTDPK